MSAVRGRVEPRLWTPPLRELTPATSFGFAVNDFARNVLHHPYDPWQGWLSIHGGELLPDGRPRFRIVLVLVARQNGKTEVPVVLSTYWQFVESVPLILGTSTKLDYAKESWNKAVKLIERTVRRGDVEAEAIKALMPQRRWTRDTNGEQESWTTEDSRYKIAASNPEGGRSLTVSKLILDELRQHRSYEAYDAAEPATSAVWDAQIWALSNAGDINSVVLNGLRADALRFIEWWNAGRAAGRSVEELLADPDIAGDYRLGLFEWSSPEGSDPTDLEALAQANPNLGVPPYGRIDPEALLAKARRAVAKGGAALAGFKTEYMCLNVPKLDPAIDPSKWKLCFDFGDLDAVRSRVAACLDIAPDGLHATLVAAAVLPDGRVRVEPVAAWDGPRCTAELRRDLPGHLARVRPRAFGWLPNGPAAALAADLKDRGRAGWPPPGVKVEEIRGEVPAICMGLAELVGSRQLAHANDPLLNTQTEGAEKLRTGNTWVFSRKGGGHCDAVYAVAGAAHLARTMPAPVGKPRLVVAP